MMVFVKTREGLLATPEGRGAMGDSFVGLGPGGDDFAEPVDGF
jgi:hypothetical protein